MTAILGISAYYHDSAVALVVDGQIVAAMQEERFSRQKHDSSFPRQAITACLESAGLQTSDLDYVGFYDKPLLKFDRLLETYVSHAPRGYRSYSQAMPSWLTENLRVRRDVKREFGPQLARRLVFAEHHESHAASSFFPSPFENAAILTVDGVGEWATASFGTGNSSRIELTHELRFPHSLGLLYSAFTYFCGFRVNSGEYKLMGLAPYGEPRYVDVILERLIELRDDGSFWMDQSYFNYCHGLTMTSRKFARLFGGSPREAESEITQREMDLAASIQAVTEEILLRMARHVHAETGQSNLCLAGGVALNSVANGRVLREGPFDQIWVQPAASDAGGALGVAMLIAHQLLDEPRPTSDSDRQRGSLLGPGSDAAAIRTLLDDAGATYRKLDNETELCREVAQLLADEKVISWFQGRMEYGPRALGSRSILADPRSPRMQTTLNQRIKRRESFRPFAPAVLRECVAEWFEVTDNFESPYMAFVVPLHQDKRKAVPATTGLAQLNQERSDVPAVTHIDNSARIQTVDAQRHSRMHRLLTCFHDLTSVPMLVNTSFNVRGEPIVCTPSDAYRCFLSTDIDVLVLGDFILLKSKQASANQALESCDAPQAKAPRRLAAIWQLWRSITRSIANVLGTILLTAAFFLVITPIGLIIRALGRDPMHRRRPTNHNTFWHRRPPPPDARRHFRQY